MKSVRTHKSRLWKAIVVIVAVFAAYSISGLMSVGPGVGLHLSEDQFIADLTQRIPDQMVLYHIPGASIALVKDRQVIWTQAFGHADVDGHRLLTTDTPMRVQSISKSVTAWGVMKLAEDGRIDLDEPVATYLKRWAFPKSVFSASRITTRQLLSHTSGLPLGDVFTIYSPEETLPSLEDRLTEEARLTREAGVSFSYSNTAYNLLELLVEEVSDQEFSDYMEQEVLKPLGMKHSDFTWDRTWNPQVPVGYDLHNNPIPVYVYPEKGSGGLFSTAEDIAVFTIAGMAGRGKNDQEVLDPETVWTLYEPVSKEIGIYGLVYDAYALGYYYESLSTGSFAVSHGGQGSGIMTHFHAVPETGDAIVILTNSQRSWPFIASVLSDWAHWCGISSVGMGLITWGQWGIWTVVGLIWSAVVFRLIAMKRAMGSRRKKQPAHFRYSARIPALQIITALASIGVLLWCSVQRYLFFTSVFPRASGWLAVSILFLSIMMLLSGLYSYIVVLHEKRGIA